MGSTREAAERAASLAQPDVVVRPDAHRSTGFGGQVSGVSRVRDRQETDAALKEFRVANPDPTPERRKEDYASYWTQEKYEAAIARKKAEADRQAEIRRQAREAAAEQARQRTQAILMEGVREELISIFAECTADEWMAATQSVKADGLLGTAAAPEAYRIVLLKIREKK